MKKKDLKQRIQAEFASETPDLLSSIQAACKGVRQERVIEESKAKRPALPLRRQLLIYAVCFAILLSGFAVYRLLPREGIATSAETYVYFDVNPSIELQLDENGQIIKVVAGNGDAESILQGLDLAGADLDTATAAIFEAMYDQGYLSADSNSILVSVDTKDETDTSQMLNHIKDRINLTFESKDISCAIIAQAVEASEELRERAQEQGVSVGKLYLAEKMKEGLASLDSAELSELCSLSIGELNLLYLTQADTEAGSLFDGDVVSGFASGFLKVEEALSSLLDTIELHSEILEDYESEASYEEIDGEWHLIYLITIVLKDDIVSYRYKVDCRTGEVLDFDLDFNFELP